MRVSEALERTRTMWTKVGSIFVDSGLCWVGDPCYLKGSDRPMKDWGSFVTGLDRHITEYPDGVAVSTGYGDGKYPVYVRQNMDSIIEAVKVVFVPNNRRR